MARGALDFDHFNAGMKARLQGDSFSRRQPSEWRKGWSEACLFMNGIEDQKEGKPRSKTHKFSI